MRKYRHLTTLMVSFVLALAVSGTAKAGGEIQASYDRSSGTLSLLAQSVDLEDVFTRVSEEAGIWVQYLPPLNRKVTIELQDVPLDDALHQLARGLNYALFYESELGRRGGKSYFISGLRILPDEAMQGSSAPSGNNQKAYTTGQATEPSVSSDAHDPASVPAASQQSSEPGHALPERVERPETASAVAEVREYSDTGDLPDEDSLGIAPELEKEKILYSGPGDDGISKDMIIDIQKVSEYSPDDEPVPVSWEELISRQKRRLKK